MKRQKLLATRLRQARTLLRRDRQALIETERWPGRELDAQTREFVAEYDEAISAVSEAIKLTKETRS